MAAEKLVGKVTHYYDKLGVGIFKLTAALKVGDQIHIKGAHDDFTQEVKEIQFDHKTIDKGSKGKEVGVKVEQKVHENDQVFVVS